MKNSVTLLPFVIMVHVCFAQPDTKEEQAIERISVTAQKREQSIKDVPIAVTSFWQDDIEKLRTFDVFDISFHTPGFSAGQFNLGQPQFFIRGIGSNEDGAGGDNAVVVNLDGVPIGRAAGSLFEFSDIERVEILRGPQGTLYGRNAVGGTINLISKRPDSEPRTDLQLELGEHGIVDAKAIVTSSLAQGKYLTSLALSHKQRDALVRSVYGPHQSNINDSGIKGQVYNEVSESLNWRLIGDYTQVRRQAPGRHAIGGAIAPLVEAYDPTIKDNPFINLSPYEGHQDRDSLGLTLLVDQELTWANLHSITAYRQTEITSAIDQFGISEQEGLLLDVLGFGLAGTNDVEENSWQVSQELHLSQQSEDLFWLMGLFYFHESVDRTETFNARPTSISFQQNNTDSFALFGETSYYLTSEWTATAGGRLSWEQKQVAQSAIAGLLIINEDYNIAAKQDWHKFTPKIAINFTPTSSVTTYLSVATGFKSGGFQGQAPSAQAASTPFDAENALAYELGLKWHVPRSFNRLHLALFHMNYDDLQVLQLVDDPNDPNDVGALLTENAADATSRGIELEWQWQLAPAWLIRGHYAYLDATYDRFLSAQGDFAGNHLRNAPAHAASLAFNHTMQLTSGAQLNFTYSHSYKDIRYQDPANLAYTAIPSHDVANLDVNYQPDNGHWQLGVWINNVWDELYYHHGFPILGSGIMTVAPSRSAGVRFRLEF